MDEQKPDQATILTDLDNLSQSVQDFPYYNLKDQKPLKFGQYVSTIEANRKNLLDKIARLQSNLTQFLAELNLVEES